MGGGPDPPPVPASPEADRSLISAAGSAIEEPRCPDTFHRGPARPGEPIRGMCDDAAVPQSILEVIALDAADARAARDGGADRIELVADMRRQGLTPAVATFAAVRAAVGIPVRVMLRAADDQHRGAEHQQRPQDLGLLRAQWPDGVKCPHSRKDRRRITARAAEHR